MYCPAGGEAVHAAVAVAVGGVQVARRRGRQPGRTVEGAARPQHDTFVLEAAGVGGLAPVAHFQQHFAAHRQLHRHVSAPVGEVNHVVGAYVHRVRLHDVAAAPGVQEVSVPVEHQHRRVLLLLAEIDPVLGVHHHAGDDARPHPVGQPAPALVNVKTEIAGFNQRHDESTPFR